MLPINKVAVPNLLTTEREYSPQQEGNHRNVLRLFFTQLVSSLNAIITWRDDNHNWMSGWDTNTQTIADPTQAYVVQVNNIDPNSVGFTVDDTYTVTTPIAGLFIMQFSLQITNSSTGNTEAASAWVRLNGTDMADSRSTVSIHQSHGGLNGSGILTVIFTLFLKAGDRIQLMWAGTSTDLSLETLPVSVTPPMPASPSVIASIFQVA